MLFFETRTFTKLVGKYLTDDDQRELQAFLISNPRTGDVIQGTAGFRKLRWRDPRRGKGKRGGLRVIYYHFAEDDQIWLMTLYDKDTLDDIDDSTKRLLRNALEAETTARQAIRRRR